MFSKLRMDTKYVGTNVIIKALEQLIFCDETTLAMKSAKIPVAAIAVVKQARKTLVPVKKLLGPTTSAEIFPKICPLWTSKSAPA